jgi:amidase
MHTVCCDGWLGAQEQQQACAKREAVRGHLEQLLGADGCLLVPTAPGPAPPLALPARELDDWRKRLLSLTCIAGLARLPQVTLPVAAVDGLPVGLSLVGPYGSDMQLLDIAARLCQQLSCK